MTFTLKGGSSGAQYEMMLAVVVDWTDVYQCVYDAVDATSIQYTFQMPSDYGVWVYEGDEVVATTFFSVTGTDYVAARVKSIMSGCAASDDYGKALYAHDYLATHAYYDSTYCYHGADNILLNGYGVCQSFSEAYRLLMEYAGIRVRIIGSDAMCHEWNAVRLEGSMYEVDVTWDTYGFAPAGQGSPSSDCGHIYCFVSDDILRYDHYGHSCADAVLMDCNYYVKSGDADAWMRQCLNSVLTDVWKYGEVECAVSDYSFSIGRYDIVA